MILEYQNFETIPTPYLDHVMANARVMFGSCQGYVQLSSICRLGRALKFSKLSQLCPWNMFICTMSSSLGQTRAMFGSCQVYVCIFSFQLAKILKSFETESTCYKGYISRIKFFTILGPQLDNVMTIFGPALLPDQLQFQNFQNWVSFLQGIC